MLKETEEKVEKISSELEELTNVYGCHDSLASLANRMATMHRTLVQSFTSGFVIPFVRELAKMHRVGCEDGRNKAAAEACDEMCKALELKYDIGEEDEIRLPCI